MTLYERIKQRRIELKMTQEELAKLTGYTSRTSIAKIESGAVDLPFNKIHLFAKALHIDDIELLGLKNEDPNITQEEYYNNPEVAKMAEEMSARPGLRVLFDASRDLTEDSLKMFAEMIETFKKTNPDG